MSFLRNITTGLRSLFRKKRVSQELDEELNGFLEMAAEEKMKEGMSRKDSLRAVRLERGSLEVTKEVVRSAGWESFVETLWQDLRYAMRSLRKSPVLATVVVLSLALGIGANTAIFSLIDAVMLRFLPVQTPQELVAVQMQTQGRPLNDTFTNALWEAVRDQQDVFSGMLAWSGPQQFDLAQGGGVRYVKGLFVSGGYFTTLGIRPVAGRLISNADDHRGCAPLAVLSYGFWQSDFAGAESAIGNTVSLRGHPFEVIGVAPPRFYGAEVGKDFDIATLVAVHDGADETGNDTRASAGATRSSFPAGAARRDAGGRRKLAEAFPGNEVDPDSRSKRHLRSARLFQSSVGNSHGDGGAGASYCLREHHQPDAGEKYGAKVGSLNTEGPGRFAEQSYPATRH